MINLTTDLEEIKAALVYKIDGINKQLNILANKPVEGNDFVRSVLEESRDSASELLDKINQYTDEGYYNLVLLDDDKLNYLCNT